MANNTQNNNAERKLPWWTWVAPFFISTLGTWMSIWFRADPGTSLWYFPTAFGVVMAFWWGPRILIGVFLNAALWAHLWDLPWEFSPLYALPETIQVLLAWFLFKKIAKGKCWIPNIGAAVKFVFFAALIPILASNMYLVLQLIALKNIPFQALWDNYTILVAADLASSFAFAIPVLILFTRKMYQKGLTFEEGEEAERLLPETRNRIADIIFTISGLAFLSIILFFLDNELKWFFLGAVLLLLSLRYGINITMLGIILTVFLGVMIRPLLVKTLIHTTAAYKDILEFNLGLLLLSAFAILTGRATSDLLDEIKRRAKAEQTLLASEEKYRMLFENSIVGIGISTPAGEVLAVNKAMSLITGYSQEEFSRINVSDTYVNPDDRKMFLEIMQREGRVENLKIQLKNKNEDLYWACLSSKPILYDGRYAFLTSTLDITKNEEANEQLHNLSKFPDENPNPVLRVSPDGILMYANKSCSKILDIWKIKQDEKLPEKWIKLIKDVYKSGKDRTFEEEIHDITYSFSLAPIKENSYINVYGTDITERVVAEKTLKESESKYKELLHILNSGIVVHAPDSSILFSNLQAQKILGLNEKQMLGKEKIDPYWKFIREDGTALPLNEYPVSRVISTKKILSNMVLGIKKPKQKTITWVLISGFPVFNQKNNLKQAIITFIDITEHKNAELELEGYRLHLEDLVAERTADLAKLTREQQTIFDSVPATIWYKDTENNIIKVNKAAADALGKKVEDMEGHPSSELFPEQAEQYYQDDLSVIKSGKPKLGIIETLKTASGETGWLMTDKIPVKDEKGKVTGLIAFAIDITKRKKAEDALQERYAEVNNLNKAMINLLEDHEEAKKQLLRNQQQLESINRELESFSYAVSHDLRAPLRGLDGFSQILLEDYADKLDAEGKDHLQRIQKASTRMGMLIDDLLRLSRITRAQLAPEEVNLSQIVNEIAKELAASQRKRKVVFIIQPDVHGVGDQQLLRIALENMLKNAWKFSSKKKSAKIEFGTKQFENIKQTVYFIKDNGAGFDMEYADKLFAAFQRLHSSEEFEGTGIGLATVNRIILRHQGKIWAESTINKGAVFYFTLS